MALYEIRTYTVRADKMAEAMNLYQEEGFPALQKGGQDKKLVGYLEATPVCSTRSCTCGSLMTMRTAARFGPACRRTRNSSKVSPRNSDRCWYRRR